MKPYGHEVIVDVREADVERFNRPNIEKFLAELCNELGLERASFHFWEYETQRERDEAPAHLRGVSAVQFVTTSTIVIHTLDASEQVLLNVFACGDVDAAIVRRITLERFGGRIASCHSIQRGGDGLLEKLPTPQRMAPDALEALTQMLFESPDDVETLNVGQVLDAVTDLRDLRNAMAGPADDPRERVNWHLEQLAAEFEGRAGAADPRP